MCIVLLWVELPRLGGLRLHSIHHLKDLRANYAACYSSKQDRVSFSGWNGLFCSFFLRCEENGTGLPNARNLSTSGDISDR